MRIVENSAAQGDVLFLRVKDLPAYAVPVASERGRAVVAHSETGHHHVAVGEHLQFYGTPNPMVNFLVAHKGHADVVHERPHDTHETLRLPEGVWEVRRQREMFLEERPVAD